MSFNKINPNIKPNPQNIPTQKHEDKTQKHLDKTQTFSSKFLKNRIAPNNQKHTLKPDDAPTFRILRRQPDQKETAIVEISQKKLEKPVVSNIVKELLEKQKSDTLKIALDHFLDGDLQTAYGTIEKKIPSFGANLLSEFCLELINQKVEVNDILRFIRVAIPQSGARYKFITEAIYSCIDRKYFLQAAELQKGMRPEFDIPYELICQGKNQSALSYISTNDDEDISQICNELAIALFEEGHASESISFITHALNPEDHSLFLADLINNEHSDFAITFICQTYKKESQPSALAEWATYLLERNDLETAEEFLTIVQQCPKIGDVERNSMIGSIIQTLSKDTRWDVLLPFTEIMQLDYSRIVFDLAQDLIFANRSGEAAKLLSMLLPQNYQSNCNCILSNMLISKNKNREKTLNQFMAFLLSAFEERIAIETLHNLCAQYLLSNLTNQYSTIKNVIQDTAFLCNQLSVPNDRYHAIKKTSLFLIDNRCLLLAADFINASCQGEFKSNLLIGVAAELITPLNKYAQAVDLIRALVSPTEEKIHLTNVAIKLGLLNKPAEAANFLVFAFPDKMVLKGATVSICRHLKSKQLDKTAIQIENIVDESIKNKK